MAIQCITFLKEKIKAVRLVFIGRVIFCVLLSIQCGFLAAYPTTYTDDTRWITVFLLYIPALAYWIHCLWTEATLIRMFFTWGLYVVFALIPNIAITYALVGDDLDKDKFLGPNTLKVMLCITPVLFLFVPNTASDLSENEEYRELAFKLTLQITIDLFDSVEMLDIVLDESENSHGIPKGFAIVMVAVACFSFLLSLVQLAENKLDEGKHELRKDLAKYRNLVQLFCVNLVFLIIRLVIFFKYKKEESIFIAKNAIAMYMSAMEIYWIIKESEVAPSDQV